MIVDVTPRQWAFIRADADEVLFGGAAGGGKSYGQVVDALLFAANYAGSRQLILRRTYPELERSLIAVSLSLFPQSAARFVKSERIWRFANGSVIEFGHCAAENDVTRYQSAEYDVIRFDELTHFTEFQYRYLLSRVRGVNAYPKQVKSASNPGGIGHQWVKARFVDPRPPGVIGRDKTARAILYLPATARDNHFLMRADPGYLKRLAALPENQRRALLNGDWDLPQGRFFPEFGREGHVVRPFAIPAHWRRYRAIDYGLDMLACYWAAFDTAGRGIVYRELYRPGLIISQAAEQIRAMTPQDERIERTCAPPDLWGRSADTGKSQAEMFFEQAVPLSRVSAAREAGWLNLREWLRPSPDESGGMTPRLRIFAGCVNLIRALGAIQCDENNPNDCAVHPHELTHAPDALRYLLAGRPCPAGSPGEDEGGEYDSFLMFGR